MGRVMDLIQPMAKAKTKNLSNSRTRTSINKKLVVEGLKRSLEIYNNVIFFIMK